MLDLGHAKNLIDIDELLDYLGSQSPGSCSPAQPTRSSGDYQDLKTKFVRLQREKEDDSDFFNNKIR